MERGRITIDGFDPERVTEREPLSEWTDESTVIARSRWQRAFQRFRRNRSAMLGVFIVTLMALLAFYSQPVRIAGITVQPFHLAPRDPQTILYLQDPSVEIYDNPSFEYPMGTDQNGRDMLSRVMVGGRYSISIGLIVVSLTGSVGLVYGAISGYYGGWVDELMMRIVDTVFAFPALVLALVIVTMLGKGYWELVIAFSAFGWAGYARIMRGEVLKVKQEEYVTAAKALGARDPSVIFRHIVPNALAPLIVQASLSIGTVVIGVAALAFLGLGFPSGTPEWGTILDSSRQTLIQGPGGSIPWWATVYPGMAIFTFVMSMNLIGDGINDALDAQEVAGVQGAGGD